MIVVDGQSGDNTLAILQDYIAEHPYAQIKVIKNPKKITPAGINIGIKHAKGSIIAIIGAHNYISGNYLSRAIEYLVRNPDLRQKMGENGRRAVEEKYNWEREGQKLINLYGNLLSR